MPPLVKRTLVTALRVWLGVAWLVPGLAKVRDAAWTGADAGAAVAAFAQDAVAKAAGANPAVHAWYAEFLEGVVIPNAALFGHLVAWAEVLVGAALVLGAFTGFAALIAALMNVNYLLAGAIGVNPLLLAVALLILVGIEQAEPFGVDGVLRPRVEEAAGKGVKTLKERTAL